MFFKWVDNTADGALNFFRFIERCQKEGEKDCIITEREPSGLPVVLFEVHAHAAVIGTIKVELTDLEFLLIDDNITEHNQLLEQFFAK